MAAYHMNYNAGFGDCTLLILILCL